ncbi:MAG: UDP-N-acetylmuramoyl-L-alanyl-D-glutamate--2,6-diaminopimelate ligase [Gammaproteobacteria bacterium]|nr:MAG: UDP-N-acetylmuramoyl-L-alanyl-D-glutamate--2,6-diaminopimelate ligase [Gammaproteobacteria bacterium]
MCAQGGCSMPAKTPERAALLPELLENLGIPDIPKVAVKGLSTDSRELKKGYVFVALNGNTVNGRDFVEHARKARVSAILMDADDGLWGGDVADIPILLIPGLRCLLGRIAARFYSEPCYGDEVIGVTGTNGKTSVVWLLAQALGAVGRKAALVGTLGAGAYDHLYATGYTTPGPVELQALLRCLHDNEFNAVCMEVSSHGLSQCRVNGVAFTGAVFTNLSRDHLDYHGNMENYAAVKGRLFAFEGLSFAVINRDDAYAQRMRDQLAPEVRVIEFGAEEGDVHVLEQNSSERGLDLLLQTPLGECHINTRLIGHFNVYNLLAVVATLVALDVAPAEIEKLAPELQPVPGRMEVFGQAPSSPLVIVDYAHTPDALKQVLMAAREHTEGELWCVFGCGGDRDRGKRPLMGKMAELFADEVVIADDNPRHEDPDLIVEDIVAGMKQKPVIIRDRAEAIEWAITQAQSGDVVVIAGKGHETVQLVGDEALPFSDREVVEKILGRAA